MTDVITDRISGVTAALAFKTPCVAIATTPITLAGLQSVGGVVVDEDDRVIVGGQADTTENGIYDASTGAWSRALDFDGARDVVAGTLVSVYGAAGQTDMYEVRGTDPIVIGTSAIAFALRYGANTRYDRTPDEITAGITPTNYSYSGASRFTGNIKRFGCVCDGVTDDTAAFQRAIDSIGTKGGYLFVPGDTKLTSQILIHNKTGLTIEIERASTITFTDGNYVGFQFQGGQNHKIINGSIYGSNHTTPTITLVQFGLAGAGNQTPLCVVQDVNFAYANVCVNLGSTYETTLRSNIYSNAKNFVTVGGLGATAALFLLGETYGSMNMGDNTNYGVIVQAFGCQINGCYWENGSQNQNAIHFVTGAQNCQINGGLIENSGAIKCETSNDLTINGLRIHGSYDATNLYCIRMQGGGAAQISGCSITHNSIPASVVGLSSSTSNLTVTGCRFDKCATGMGSSGAGPISSNNFANCTVGLNTPSGSAHIIDNNYFTGNTTGQTLGGSSESVKNSYSTNGTNLTVSGSSITNEAVRGATASVTDGATITHGHVKTPTRAFAQGSVASQFVSVTAIGATTFTVAIKKDDGTAGTSQTIYWEVSG